MPKKYAFFLFLFFSYTAYSQDSLDYRVDLFGSVSSGKYTPFWMTSNTYGIVPLRPNNGYARGDLDWKHSFLSEVQIETEADIVAAVKHTSSFWFQQLYAAASYRNMVLFIGSKERYTSMLDKNLSMGDMTFSPNARPSPEINFSFSDYTTFPFTKRYIKFKADFAFGKALDNNYILRTKVLGATYTLNTLYHHKSLYIKWEDPTDRFPFFGIIGLEHAAQWGGRLSNFGNQPSSLKDLIRIILCHGGNSDATLGDQINVLGNHLGTYNVKIGFQGKKVQAALYKQHYYEDKSGLEMANWRDGIWGGEITFFNQQYLQKIVVEYLQTTNQSGPFLFLKYDWILYPKARGGGNDSYYNNGGYPNGWSYFGRAIGNPILTSPEYNADHSLGFEDNRVKAYHLGFDGNISDEVSYRTLFTEMSGWGTMTKPFLQKESDFSSLFECTYNPKKQKNWRFAVQVSFDIGDMYSDNFGCSVKISKSGIIGK